MTAGTCACAQNCGQPVYAKDYAAACYRRWIRQGRPASGPRVPLTFAEMAGRAAAARTDRALPPARELPPDDYDARWAEGEPERRVNRARRQAGALVQCVAASDAEGIRLLLHKVRDFPALAVVLAECADPARTALVTGVGTPERRAALSVAPGAAQEAADAA